MRKDISQMEMGLMWTKTKGYCVSESNGKIIKSESWGYVDNIHSYRSQRDFDIHSDMGSDWKFLRVE